MDAAVLTGWKWLWLPLVIIVGLVVLVFLWGALAYAYTRLRHPAGMSLTDDLDKEQAIPRSNS